MFVTLLASDDNYDPVSIYEIMEQIQTDQEMLLIDENKQSSLIEYIEDLSGYMEIPFLYEKNVSSVADKVYVSYGRYETEIHSNPLDESVELELDKEYIDEGERFIW